MYSLQSANFKIDSLKSDVLDLKLALMEENDPGVRIKTEDSDLLASRDPTYKSLNPIIDSFKSAAHETSDFIASESEDPNQSIKNASIAYVLTDGSPKPNFEQKVVQNSFFDENIPVSDPKLVEERTIQSGVLEEDSNTPGTYLMKDSLESANQRK